jgi:hypothetical protein
VGASVAFVLFALIYVIPGYTAGWSLDLFDFRRRLPGSRFVIAIVLSLAISPILTFLSYHFSSVGPTFVLLGAFAVAFIVILARTKQPATPPAVKRLQWIAIVSAAAWSTVAIISLTDLQWGNRLYNNSVAYDFTTRVAIINSITRSGVPPINASYFPGHPIRMTFVYYFWYIPCSLVEQLGGSWVDAHAAMIASVAWCGLALVSGIALYLRIRNPEGGEKAWRTGLLGGGLLLVSGLDILAVLLNFTNLIWYHGDLEHWNEQITAWVGSLSWVPHHVAGLIACMAAVILIHWMRGQKASKQLGAAVVAGLALASAIGLSVYVTLVFVAFWGIWLITLFFQNERRLSLWMVLIGAIAVVAANPFLLGLIRGSESTQGGAGLPVALAVRVFTPILPFVGAYPPRLLDLIDLLVLPINYLMELGFFFVAALFWVRAHGSGKWKQNPYHLAEVILLGVTVFIGSFVRSTVISSNDFGWRSWLPGQFVLLIWGADIIASLFPSGLLHTRFEYSQTRRLAVELKALLLLGLLTSVADIALLRTWPLFEDAGITSAVTLQCPDLQQGKRTMAARLAYDYINTNTPQGAIIEPNPVDLLNKPAGLYANRQIAASGLTTYGVSQDELMARAALIARIFRSSTWPEIDASCRQFSINLIVANDQDPIWDNLTVLEAQRQPIYHNGFYAVLPCGESPEP